MNSLSSKALSLRSNLYLYLSFDFLFGSRFRERDPPSPNPPATRVSLTLPLRSKSLSLSLFLIGGFDSSPPSIAYLISGSAGDSGQILRLLLATYHPKNQYLLHLDLTAPQSKCVGLALSIQSIPIFKAAQNVNVVGKADFAYPKGSSGISFTLRGASVRLIILLCLFLDLRRTLMNKFLCS
ncbi:hypothetical protein CMV_025367 [Castanea mollissima]|uniref:Uncharacterized protein n=1 Tax=Castanea mollissima TaxID=60419 RepID=A0A8J4QLN5_9ROSI|nr:hypothetical protein CMV_025367 [Castanea mollissima]